MHDLLALCVCSPIRIRIRICVGVSTGYRGSGRCVCVAVAKVNWIEKLKSHSQQKENAEKLENGTGKKGKETVRQRVKCARLICLIDFIYIPIHIYVCVTGIYARLCAAGNVFCRLSS